MARTGRAARRTGAPGNGKALATATLTLTLLATLLAAPFGLLGRRALAEQEERFPQGGTISEVRVEGNVTITTEQVRAKLLSKAGAPLDQNKIDADMKSLLGTKWFSSVEPLYTADPGAKGFLLIFRVQESPVLSSVEFRGRNKVKLSEIEESTGLKKGNRADAARTRMAVGQIQRLYAEKGYELADVQLVEGGERGDTRVVIQIFEGPKLRIGSIDFQGNVFATDATLQTKIGSRAKIVGLFGGKYHRDELEEDQRKLAQYYQDQGFYMVKVAPVTRTGSSLGDVHLTFVISEGTRYKVRAISFEGNTKLSEEKLREGLLIKPGEPVLAAITEADRKTLLAKYNELGCVNTQIQPKNQYPDQPGVVDIVYQVEEGNPTLLAELIIRGNERTKKKVILREAAMAGIRPGELLNLNYLDKYKTRLGNLGYFVNSPDQGRGKAIDIKISTPRPGNMPYGEIAVQEPGDLTRMQGPEPEPPAAAGVAPVVVPPLNLGGGPPRVAQGASTPSALAPFGAARPFSPRPDTLPPNEVPDAPPLPAVVPGPGGSPATPPIGAGEPPGDFPSIPGLNMTDVGPDRQDPFPNRSWADIITSVEEAPTGRFMLGIGASGFQGLNGTVSVYEKNFDILNLPRSLDDITSGKAFRGGGQDFQLSLMAGTLINRFQISLREPYLFDLPIGASSSGYLFQRIYPDWTEGRAGGRFALGRQFGPATYADLAFRAENVQFRGFNYPAPAEYLAAAGHSLLVSVRPTLRFDNRNAPFMPNKGQYLEFAFEQAGGTFTYSKFEVEGRKYFTLFTRPDGSGPRVLSLRGHLGVTGKDTPVYERFFAGYLGSLRGFGYRGVGPHVDGLNVGGFLQALGSIEYMFPLTASDSVRQVVFCDFGTIENSYEIHNFRASVGTGLRVTIPAFGPLPLAFDLGFPIAKAVGDKVNIFNFSIGAVY